MASLARTGHGQGVFRSPFHRLNYTLAALYFNGFPLPRREAGTRQAMQYAGELVSDGWSILIFPEGAHTDTGEIAPFHPGVAMLAARLGVPVVPVALRYEPTELAWIGQATFMPHYLRLAERAVSTVRLRFGEPLRAGPDDDAASLANAARGRVLALLEAT